MKDFNYLVKSNGKIISNFTHKPICQWKDNVGYLQVIVMKNNKRYYKRVHRIIAETFLANPKGLPQVNHVDGDKTNNDIENLEWIDNRQNTIHGYKNKLYHSKKRNIKIDVYTKDGEYISTYKSIRNTSEILNINRKTLSRILFDDKVNNYDYIFKVAS